MLNTGRIKPIFALGQTPLKGVDSWYVREEEAVEDKTSSSWWKEAGTAALSP